MIIAYNALKKKGDKRSRGLDELSKGNYMQEFMLIKCLNGVEEFNEKINEQMRAGFRLIDSDNSIEINDRTAYFAKLIRDNNEGVNCVTTKKNNVNTFFDPNLDELRKAFPGCYLDFSLNFVSCNITKCSFPTKDCMSEFDIKFNMIDRFIASTCETEPACEDVKNKESQAIMLRGVNEYLSTNFSSEQMGYINSLLDCDDRKEKISCFINSGYQIGSLFTIRDYKGLFRKIEKCKTRLKDFDDSSYANMNRHGGWDKGYWTARLEMLEEWVISLNGCLPDSATEEANESIENIIDDLNEYKVKGSVDDFTWLYSVMRSYENDVKHSCETCAFFKDKNCTKGYPDDCGSDIHDGFESWKWKNADRMNEIMSIKESNR